MQPADPADNSSLASHDVPWLHPELIDAVARRVLELVREPGTGAGSATSALLTVAEIAERLGVSPKWVYAH
jgi:DNA-binding Lrp family transcriptional regulator